MKVDLFFLLIETNNKWKKKSAKIETVDFLQAEI
jgi:hypothetical protein